MWEPFLASVDKLADIVMLNREEAIAIEARRALAEVFGAGGPVVEAAHW